MTIGIATKIIQSGASNNFFNNIIDTKYLKAMWDKLKAVCSQISLGVIYSIFQEFFIYPKFNKPKEFKKPITSIFVKVQFLIKQQKTIVTPKKDI